MTIENIFLAVVLIISAIFDYKFRKVPNALIFPAVISGLVLAVGKEGAVGLSSSTAGVTSGMALLTVPYVKGGIGAGDVKLLGAIGAIKGPGFVLVSFLGAAIIGGIMALWRTAFIVKGSDMMILRESIKTVYYSGALSALEVPQYVLKERLPYAVAIAAGAVLALVMEMR